jgi:hypothetical protein
VSGHVEFPLYTAAIFTDPSIDSLQVRYTAGICLNGYLSRKYTILDENVGNILKSQMPAAFNNKQKLLRRASKLILTSLMTKIGVKKCEDLVQH